MKRKVSFILAVVFLLVGLCSHIVLAGNISLFNNNTSSTYTAFSISNNGSAIVSVEYMGYPNITTNATITIKIEKRNLLVFWKDIEEWVITSDEYFDSFYRTCAVSSGKYRVTVTFEISGTGGSTDVFESQIEDSY